MNKPLCRAPFTAFSHKPEGYRPCCSRHTPAVAYTDGDWWNSPYLKEFRKTMFSYETLTDACKRCMSHLTVEDPGYSQPFDMKDYNPVTGEVLTQPSQVYVFTGTKCDLGCEICDSTFSDTHAKMYPDRILEVKVVTEDSPLHIIGRYNPKQFVLYGGEPFVSRDLYDIVSLALTKKGTISFLSNGNRDLSKHPVFNELIVPNKDRFSITFSIDGTPEVNERTRKNVRTTQILANIRLCLELGVYCDVHFTSSKLNVGNYVDFIEWLFAEKLFSGDVFTMNAGTVDFPQEYQPEQLPLEERQAIAARLDDLQTRYDALAAAQGHTLTSWQKHLLQSGTRGVKAGLMLDKA